MSNLQRKSLVAVTATLGVVACGLLGAGTAAAGTNGQQINYYSHQAVKQCTTGTNQSGAKVKNCTELRQGGPNLDRGYWWVGRVSIEWYRTGSTVSSTCDVPKKQNEDFFNCYEPS